MSNIVLSKVDKLDFHTTMTEVEVLDLLENASGDKTFIVEPTQVNLEAAKLTRSDVFVPATAVSSDDMGRVKTYFDLENYPFYQVAKEIITKDAKPKGVFRFRRTVTAESTNAIFAGDLLVLTELLGETVDIQVKQTDQSVVPSHTIVMINFGGGMMAHFEYTVSDHERIELEWSGDKNIIEFDSNEMRGVHPGNLTRLPLIYSVDSILETAHTVDEVLMKKLSNFKNLLNGGAIK